MVRWVCYCEECEDFEIVKEESYYSLPQQPLFCPFCCGEVEIYDNEDDDEI